jgi:hypothetical protein
MNSLFIFRYFAVSQNGRDRPFPKIKICHSDSFKYSRIEIFLLINQDFVAHRVKLKGLKNGKERTAMTLIVQREE